MRALLTLPTLGLLSLACGGAPPEATSPTDTPKPAAEPSPDAASTPAKASAKVEDDGSAVPTTCETKKDLCLPSPAFAKRLCGGFNPDVALALLKKGTPFTRGYLKANVDAWNASGGVSSADKLAFDEEVLVLFVRENTTGIQVSGASSSFDVLRWDGTCATLSGEELTFTPAPKPKTAKIVWKDLSEGLQAALLADANIAKLNKTRRDECKGATMGQVSKTCVKAVDKLSEAVILHVQSGGEIPVPAKIK